MDWVDIYFEHRTLKKRAPAFLPGQTTFGKVQDQEGRGSAVVEKQYKIKNLYTPEV